MSRILVAAILAFVGTASAVLLWDGLALAAGRSRAKGRELRLARARLAIGVAGFALALWIALGLLTRAR